MEMSQEDFDRILSFDQARRDSEALYAVNPDDADNLTRWGEALLELSHVQDADCCVEMIEDAVSKLEKALLVDPTKHETLWCLGNAHTSRGFCTAEHDLAKVYFGFAAQCYENALQEDPGNKMYAKSLEMALKGPELHLDLQRQSRSQQASVGGSSVSNAKESKEQGEDSLMYDIFGWVILAVGLIACVAMSSSQAPPPSPSGDDFRGDIEDTWGRELGRKVLYPVLAQAQEDDVCLPHAEGNTIGEHLNNFMKFCAVLCRYINFRCQGG